MKLRTFVLIAALAFVLPGCDYINNFFSGKKPAKEEVSGKAAAAQGTVVALVNNTPITLEELNQDISVYNALVAQEKPENKITTREQKVNYLKNEEIRQELLYQDALARGLDRSEEVIRDLEKTKRQLVLMELGKKLSENTEVGAKEIEDYYNTYKDQLKEPEQRDIREIVVGSEQEAKDILIQLLQGADFATLAKERSVSASGKSGGDLGFIAKGTKFSQFDNVAFSDSLDAGRISSIFKGPDGYYIIKIEAKRGGKQKTLSELRDDIKRMLIFLKQQQIIEDLVAKLSREAKIEIREGKVE
ncbi:MAG: peptidylprolyl isomerase [Candidatus Omnitrophota bacterium]